MSVDTRLIAYVVWGIGTTLVYFIVLDTRYRAYLRRHDARSRRELQAGFGLFLTALAANLAILLVLFGEETANARGFLSALALGAFFATGIILATERAARE